MVSMAQPKRGVIRWLLGQTYYPDNSYTRTADGDPIRPYDMSGDVIAEFMGVRVDPVGTAVEAPLTVVEGMVEPQWVGDGGSPARPPDRRVAQRRFQGAQPALRRGGERAARDRGGDGDCPGRLHRGAGGRHGRAGGDRSRHGGRLRRARVGSVHHQPTHRPAADRHVPALLRRQHGRGMDALAAGGLRLRLYQPLRRRDSGGRPARALGRDHPSRRLEADDARTVRKPRGRPRPRSRRHAARLPQRVRPGGRGRAGGLRRRTAAPWSPSPRRATWSSTSSTFRSAMPSRACGGTSSGPRDRR